LLLVGNDAMTRHRLNLSLAAVLMTALTAGCDLDALDSLNTFDCHGTVLHQTTIECHNSGGARLTSPTFPLPANLAGAGPCADAPGRCVAFSAGNGSNLLEMRISFWTLDEGTYSLRGDAPGVSGTISTAAGYTSPLVARAGALVITERDGEHVAGTFTVHIASEDGQHDIALADGTFDIGGDCRTRDHAVCVPNSNGSY
jgi:hypothetical protein